ncbi:hypothetical protein Pan241w_07660 [Gimesia alba]|uniref:Uncharacterized protein n=1 Tax=Gimesia alba TaxID=2527973 RepID=A0A517RA22_9PLAN|nr:AAA family ATPase [Gimesia alba]QDT40708.1 hypothetical protein Pan241w_07660 [Gimesia alba]
MPHKQQGSTTIDTKLDLDQFSLKIANFKCFGDTPQGFDRIKPFNLIIGKNNSGKSSLLDIMPCLVTNNFEFLPILWHHHDSPGIFAKQTIPSELLEKHVRKYARKISNNSSYENRMMQKYEGAVIEWRMGGLSDECTVESENPKFQQINWMLDSFISQDDFERELSKAMTNPFANREFQRITAERNIIPEPDSGDIKKLVKSDGSGVTTIIQKYITKSNLPRDLIKITLLFHLNQIFAPDLKFTDIDCQQHEDTKWEIYLHEEHKGLIPLSQSGSGLKTIIIVLVNILLMPQVKNKDPSVFIYGFEELENNLHPALLRNLLLYLFEHAKKTGALFFLTTHSNVAIDSFSHNKDAQIIHVTHNGQEALCRTVKTYVENQGVLDDLDVRASDLLQSNCVIWVEGPSDRTYINRWIDLFTDGNLKEGFHFQCVFYGGKLLSHLSSDSPDEIEERIALLRVNRKCCLVMDSDKKSARAHINKTKKRLREEIDETEGFSWVTNGREIENYLPVSSIKKLLGVNANQVERYEKFLEYLDATKKGSGKLLKSKAAFSESIVPLLDKSDCFSVLDLEEQISELCKFIKKCNGIET